MMPQHSGSGDLLADRRYGYAEALAAEGDHAAAADLFAQVTELVPDWAPGWLALGLARERSNNRAGAVAALRRAEAYDGDGRLGTGLHLARLAGDEPGALAPAYVAALFDQYADRFEAHLTEALRYRGPEMIAAALDAVEPGRLYAAALDLGCGTGLMARALRGRAKALDGVDLAPRMVEKARNTGLYGRVVVAEVAGFIEGTPAGSYDLALAADVFVYLGELSAILRGIARVLRPGGALAFTVQESDAGAVTFGADMRFSHSAGHVATALAAAGFRARLTERASTRQDGGRDVPGLVVVATKA